MPHDDRERKAIPMNLMDYASLLLRRGWIMILLAVVAAGAAFVFSRQMQPMYRATQTLLLVPSRSDLGIAEATNRLLANHAAYLDSKLRAAEVIERLQLDMTPDELYTNATIVPVQISLTIQIDVDNPNPAVAVDAAREWGELLVEYRNALNQESRREDRITARPQDNPSPSQISPNVLVNTLVGAILGFFIGGIIVFVLEFLESNMIRNRRDVEQYLELPVLATVPDDKG